ncbi:hypothetical protein BDZ88DRAFT_453023 [Geranomyces variabilis]|nr:hypothetical protein BDZ88DRAFT_453023 [Geranomyces variabilis]
MLQMSSFTVETQKELYGRTIVEIKTASVLMSIVIFLLGKYQPIGLVQKTSYGACLVGTTEIWDHTWPG